MNGTVHLQSKCHLLLHTSACIPSTEQHRKLTRSTHRDQPIYPPLNPGSGHTAEAPPSGARPPPPPGYSAGARGPRPRAGRPRPGSQAPYPCGADTPRAPSHSGASHRAAAVRSTRCPIPSACTRCSAPRTAAAGTLLRTRLGCSPAGPAGRTGCMRCSRGIAMAPMRTARNAIATESMLMERTSLAARSNLDGPSRQVHQLLRQPYRPQGRRGRCQLDACCRRPSRRHRCRWVLRDCTCTGLPHLHQRDRCSGGCHRCAPRGRRHDPGRSCRQSHHACAGGRRRK